MILLLSALAFSIQILSPNKEIAAVITDGEENLEFMVFNRGHIVVNRSKIGILADGITAKPPFTFSELKNATLKEEYPMYGAHAKAVNHYNQVSFLATDASNHSFYIDVRAFNDGVAYRYRLPENRTHSIIGELTSWRMPLNSVFFFQDHTDFYEGQYHQLQGVWLSPSKVFALPMLFHLSTGDYAMLTESNLYAYPDMAVISNCEQTVNAFFHANYHGFTLEGPVTTPWRVTLVANDLNTLANSDIVRNLADATSFKGEDLSWIKPGRSSWQWLSSGAPILEEQHDWIDRTVKLGFEYYLIDDGWKAWKQEGKDCWQILTETISYAKSKGIDCFIWVNSNEMWKPQEAIEYLKKTKATGAVGIKIDFIPMVDTRMSYWYDLILKISFDLKLMVDFHGCVKPTGRQRTWPNEMTREAIHGHEWISPQLNSTARGGHDTALVFTRLVQGPADYTPTVLTPMDKSPFTYSREVAQAIVLTSPFLCFGDNPKMYLESNAVEIIKQIPSVYDETIVLNGSAVGEVAAFARRKGGKWFIGIENNEVPRTLEVPLTFLGEGEYSMLSTKDPAKGKECIIENKNINRKNTLTIRLAYDGGFAAIISPANHNEL